MTKIQRKNIKKVYKLLNSALDNLANVSEVFEIVAKALNVKPKIYVESDTAYNEIHDALALLENILDERDDK